jgi:GT2 family glycosyltransferase
LAPGAQTLPFGEYEVIVTDDGRETTAEEMVRERFPWARWTQGPRRGPAANRNHGATLARGGWLVFTDDDCLPEAGWLEAYARAVGGSARALEGSIHPIGDIDRDLAECPVNLTGGLFWSANIAVQQALFDEVGGFDERYTTAAHEDEDLYLRLRERASTAYVPDAAVFHPVRVDTFREAISRIPKHARVTALYYSVNGRRLGIRRGSTLVRWLYKPRGVAFVRDLVQWRPRSAVVELAWLAFGNMVVLRYWAAQNSMLRKGAGCYVP